MNLGLPEGARENEAVVCNKTHVWRVLFLNPGINHASLFHDAARSFISQGAVSRNLRRFEHGKIVVNDCLHRLCHITTPPISTG